MWPLVVRRSRDSWIFGLGPQRIGSNVSNAVPIWLSMLELRSKYRTLCGELKIQQPHKCTHACGTPAPLTHASAASNYWIGEVGSFENLGFLGFFFFTMFMELGLRKH